MLEKLIGNSWSSAVEPYLDKEYFKWLGIELQSQYKNYTVFPSQEQIFNAFKFTPYDKVNIVILGMDPYIKQGQAYGVSFGVQEDCFIIPPSLRNIEKEIEDDIYKGFNLSFDYSLKNWYEQGCFMYNTALTVIEGKTGSHLKIWAPFTEAVMKALNDKEFCIYLLLGKNAQEFSKYVDTKEKQFIINAPHPAAEAYAGGNAGFFGSKVFSEINNILELNNRPKIIW